MDFFFFFCLRTTPYLKISGKPVSELGGIALIYVGVSIIDLCP